MVRHRTADILETGCKLVSTEEMGRLIAQKMKDSCKGKSSKSIGTLEETIQ
jgi:hypothetical protein